MRIGILGVGAIGSVMSLALKEGLECLLFNRSPRVKISVEFAGKMIVNEVECIEPFTAPELDWLLVCLKAYQYEGASNALDSLISTNTKVAVLRNGIDLATSILPFTDVSNILTCSIDCPVQPQVNGTYRQLRRGQLSVPKGQLATEFQQLLDQDRMSVVPTRHFRSGQWKKLIESSSLGGVLAISGETCWIFQDPQVKIFYRQLLAEGVAVAQANGAQLELDIIDKILEKLDAYPPDKGSSMLTDRLAGRPLEVMARNGTIVEYGHRYDIPTPLHALITTLLKHTNRFLKV